MKRERLFELIGLVDEDLILQAAPTQHRSTFPIALAAAGCLVLCAVSLPMFFSAKKEAECAEPSSAAPTESASLADAPKDSAFLSYSGPVLPLTTAEKTNLTALRHLSFDVSDPETAHIYDHYEITNPTDEEISAAFLYPVTGSLGNFDQLEPRMGEWNKMTTPFAGGYAGSFESAFGSGDESGTHNLNAPSHWEDYTAIMDSGDLAYALSEKETLTETVTVYEFSDITGPTDVHRAAALAIDFSIDGENTSIMTYGFNGSTRDEENGWHQYDFFIPNGKRRDTNPKLLIVRGEDLTSYRIQGYSDGGCTIPISGVSCTVTRTEMTVDRLIDRLCRAYLQENADNSSGILNTDPQTLPLSLYRRCVAELLSEYGVLSASPTDRYADGRLDDIVAEALTLERIFYFRTPTVTIAPGETYSMTVSLRKSGSFDFWGSNTGREGIYGYEFLTTAGSSLTFLAQRFSLEIAGDLSTSGTVSLDSELHTALQNHSFSPASIANQEVLLELSQPRYYFHIASQ